MKQYGKALALGALAAALAAPLAAQQAPGLGIDTVNFDHSVRPQDDFFLFVNGRWVKNAQIPADRSRYGVFDQLAEKSETAVRALIEEAARARHAPGSALQKVGDFYGSFMDTVRVESLGLEPLHAELQAIAAIDEASELAPALGRLQRLGVDGPFGIGVFQDLKQSDRHALYLGQSGLGLPDRDYYLKDDEKSVTLRQAYVRYLARLLELSGDDAADATAAAERILALEIRLAEPQWDRVRNRDYNAIYNRMSVAQLAELAPGFDWTGFLSAAGAGEAADIIVQQPDYLPAATTIVAQTPLEVWKDYLRAHAISEYAPVLSSPFVDANFEMFGRALQGRQEQRPRWKRGVGVVEEALGEAVGKLYVERHFSPDAKARMDRLVRNLLEAFRQGIGELEWMTPETKAEAEAKLANFTVKIGYPEKWEDYGTLEVRSGDLVGNALRARAWRYEDMLDRLDEPVDRSEWAMLPQTVNAYYNPFNNEIVFPAAILQPPFFAFEADDAANYGGIGAVIGHEISHGFDDQGRKTDLNGNLRDWWTARDDSAFMARADRLAGQYGAFEPLEGVNINGKLTLGENIGDLSGVAVAYRAYRLSLGDREPPVIGGFTGDQRFFLGWGQVWRSLYRDEALRNMLMTNPHSPGPYRVNGVLRNMDAFYAAFDVDAGDGMYLPPEERVKIW